MADYKGIYYKNDNKQIFYEGGAHFNYYKLYTILKKLALQQKMMIKRVKLIENREKKNKEKDIKKTKSIEKEYNLKIKVNVIP